MYFDLHPNKHSQSTTKVLGDLKTLQHKHREELHFFKNSFPSTWQNTPTHSDSMFFRFSSAWHYCPSFQFLTSSGWLRPTEETGWPGYLWARGCLTWGGRYLIYNWKFSHRHWQYLRIRRWQPLITPILKPDQSQQLLVFREHEGRQLMTQKWREKQVTGIRGGGINRAVHDDEPPGLKAPKWLLGKSKVVFALKCDSFLLMSTIGRTEVFERIPKMWFSS